MMIFRSKLILSAFVAISLAFAGGYALAQDAQKQITSQDAKTAEISTERLALAKQYLAVAPVDEEIKGAVAQISENVKPDQRVLFRTMADKHMDYARITSAAELAAANTFTESELKALVAFFSSPEGKSVREKMPQYQKQVQPVITQVLQDFVVKIQDANILPQN